MEDDAEAYLKLPLEERCVHKLWKARVSGYEEAIKQFPRWDGDDPNWKKITGLVKKFITDTNAIAQEKGLAAALAYVENCDGAGRVVSDCVDGIVTKCVGAPKAKTKEMASQIVLMFVEIEQHEKVIEELIKGLTQKNPKVVAGCVTNLTSCLRNFGAKVIKVSPLLKAVVPLLDHRDKSVREEGKQLIIESYRWIGDMMKQQLSGLKPVQITELEAEFEKLEDTKPKPERLLRSQQAMGATVDAAGGEEGQAGGADEGDDDGGADDDPYDLMDPVNILEKLPKNFYELVEEKKWQLRGEALDALAELVKAPKIQPGDYNDLVRVLKKFIGKDTNVMLVTKAANCTAGLAKGLRSNFKNGASQILPVVLEKFKEKKATAVAALCEAADGLYSCIGVENIQEDCLASLKHKTPSVITETAKFLGRCFAKCPGALVTNKKMVKGYVSALVEKLNHSDPNVRDGASEALGVLLKVLGEPTIMKLMPDVEAIKVTKIKEFADKAELTGKLPKAAAAAPAPAAAAAASEGPPRAKVVKPKAASETKKSAASRPGAPPRAGAKTSVPAKPAATARKTSAVSSAKARPTSSAKKAKDEDLSPPYTANDLKKTRFKDETRLKILKWNFTTPRQEFVDQLKEQIEASGFNTTLQTQMFHSDFKQHLKAIESLAKHLEADVPGLVSNLDLILKWITLRFFETNPSVLLKSLEYLNDVFAILADDSYHMHDLEASCFVPYLVNKVGDPKDQVRASIKSMFKSMYQVYPASKFSPFLMEGLKHKNAKLRTECLDELGWMIKNHGMTILTNPAACLKDMAKSISDRDNSVRNAAMNAITEAYFKVGEKMYKMIGNLPEKDMAMLEERIKRVSKTRGAPSINGSPPPAVTNGQTREQAPPEPRPNSGIPAPKSSLPTTTRIKNFRQFPVPGGGPPPNIPPASAGPVTATTVNADVPMRKSPSSRDRPVSGAFTLDIAKIEGGSADADHSSHVFSRLVNHDLDDLLNGAPVVLPARSTSKRPNMPTTVQLSPERNLAESSEAGEALDVVLAQAFDTDVSLGVSALLQLEELIKDEEKLVLMVDRVDQLLVACYMQYRNVLNNKMSDWESNSSEPLKLFQKITVVLMSTYHHQTLARSASVSALCDLLQVIISILIEPKLQNFQATQGGSEGLLRALNVLTVKILDRSDPTNVTCAFVKLLTEVVANNATPKAVELVMKCLWKVIRLLPKWIEEDAIDLDVVLGEVHIFLKKFPSSYWKKQELDTPMRTAKTILHAMAKSKGDAVLDHLTKVSDPHNSELVPYLKKLLNSGVGGKENQNGAGETEKKPSKSLPRFSKSDHDQLAEIFRKIGDKEQTKQGLQELKNFKQKCPHADLEPFLARSSPYFRRYIERGLASIEPESCGSILSEAKDVNVPSDSSTAFLNKLKMLRERAGLESNVGSEPSSTGSLAGGASNNMYRISSYQSASSSGVETYSSNEDYSTSSSTATLVNEQSSASETNPNLNMDDIRRRLEKVKNSAF